MVWGKCEGGLEGIVCTVGVGFGKFACLVDILLAGYRWGV